MSESELETYALQEAISVKLRRLVDVRVFACYTVTWELMPKKPGCALQITRFETLHGVFKTAYCRLKERRVGGARAAEESMLWHQVLVCVHHVLHVLLADQSAEQFIVCRTRQVHAVIALK